MSMRSRFAAVVLILTIGAAALVGLQPATAVAADGIDPDVQAALKTLYDAAPAARTLAATAKGILVFPNIVKAGFLVGAQYGEGELLKDGKTAGYYNIAAASYGLQAGVQSFGYAMFFMSDSALSYLDNTAGFEIGAGPSIVVVDAGMAKSLTTTTGRSDVYAFIFGQKGLMAGVGLQGSKITKIRQ